MLRTHIFLIVNKIRRQISAVELHSLYDVQLIFQTGPFFDGNNTLFADFLHGLRNNVPH